MFLGEPEANKSQSSQVKVKAKVTANKSKSSQVKAKVTATVKIQLMSAQFSPVQSSPAHLEFNLNPCQLHKFSTVQVEVNFNTLVRWTVISAQGSLIHCSSWQFSLVTKTKCSSVHLKFNWLFRLVMVGVICHANSVFRWCSRISLNLLQGKPSMLTGPIGEDWLLKHTANLFGARRIKPSRWTSML